MEFGMQNAVPQQQPMEWYSTAPGGYNSSQYQYAPPPQAHNTANAYASFDDEPPLLEGMWPHLLIAGWLDAHSSRPLSLRCSCSAWGTCMQPEHSSSLNTVLADAYHVYVDKFVLVYVF